MMDRGVVEERVEGRQGRGGREGERGGEREIERGREMEGGREEGRGRERETEREREGGREDWRKGGRKKTLVGIDRHGRQHSGPVAAATAHDHEIGFAAGRRG